MADILKQLSAYVDPYQRSLYVCLISIAASPLAWNVIGRNEYKNHTLSKLVGARVACTILGIMIFLAGLLRDVLYRIALHDQPRYPLPYEIQTVLSWIIFGAGNFLVATSYHALGFYGTFAGDYFGILHEKRVTTFPFNILDNPMYLGAELCFIGAALWYERPAGLLISLYVHLTYAVALHFESPFTDMIYSQLGSSAQKHD
ncbi:phospholipid methyltransferase-domain-containing protein [Mycena belliarum]|uniref:Phosphatidyl-N-methylethanolamine N-methyltransferase n=1 Tax=Mycena belliarum TaxID=1033014 RepID=A0AAD6XJT3_9AGAR|nr:phospholipid methyltransferase-domain-containing protein [Mycena belliae]